MLRSVAPCPCAGPSPLLRLPLRLRVQLFLLVRPSLLRGEPRGAAGDGLACAPAADEVAERNANTLGQERVDGSVEGPPSGSLERTPPPRMNRSLMAGENVARIEVLPEP